MREIPYIAQPDPMSCALACYTMVAKTFYPEITFDDMAKISNWEPTYCIWAYKFWLWIMARGVKIIDYDLIDASSWANEGIEGLKKSMSEKEFNFAVQYTKDIEGYSEDIKKVLSNPNFQYNRIRPTFENLKKALDEGYICEVVLDSRTLRDRKGFMLHRVIVLDTNDKVVTFHDPAVGPKCKIGIEKFKKAWLDAVDDPELCMYQYE